MKKTYTLILSIFVCMGVYSQVDHDAFVGTWVYQRYDTVFKIKLQKGTKNTGTKGLFGGYYVSVDGITRDNYIMELPSV